jgi:TRAP-type C4-dicarboxylate transport system permease small subunit
MRQYYTPTPTDEAGGLLIQYICPVSFILGLLLLLIGLWQYVKTLQHDEN